MRSIYLLLFIILSTFSTPAYAQETFAEGVIVYKVTLDPPANQEGVVQHTGTYTVTIKGQQVKQVLMLDNGYQSTMLYNYKDKAVYSLKKIGDKHLAIQLDMEQVNARRNKYMGFTMKELKGNKEIAGINASSAIVSYSNGATTDVFYTNTLAPAQSIFERFPGATFLPLSFKTNNEDGLSVNFMADKITLQPVTDAEFRIPAHYKIISNTEYQNLTGK